MFEYKNILVVIDPEAETQTALARACELAAKCNAKVTAFMCIYDFSYELTTMLSADERNAMRKAVLTDRTEWLSTLVKPYGSDNVEVQVSVVWDNSVYESAIKAALELQADLIVKAAGSHDDLASLLFTPTDWHILRKSPTPVLMVKQHDWPVNGNVIASVNVGTEDGQHARLNDKVVETAKGYSELLKANLHLVNAYPGTVVNLAIEMPEFDPQGYNENVKRHHQNEMQKFSHKHSVAPENCHVIQGLPEAAIPQQAKSLDAELVIIGTIGRAGLSAALIGNTAEAVIDGLNCDVLAIKPDDFESPIHG
ncbi:universal stress protein UspE [Alteromonas facilis]|uniref:universal stress protein UspE n=1 Tax=Alteromonas facilis TaxID=2048004 RepID=UPI000C289A3C|nr:universal stress protein UspE [Alteromonas facilis]